MRIWPTGRRARLYRNILIALVTTPVIAAVAFLIFQPAPPPARDYAADYEALIMQGLPQGADEATLRRPWEQIVRAMERLEPDTRAALASSPEWTASPEHISALEDAWPDWYALDGPPEDAEPGSEEELSWRAAHALTIAYVERYTASGVPDQLAAMGCDAPFHPGAKQSPLVQALVPDISIVRRVGIAEYTRYLHERDRLADTARNMLICAHIAGADVVLVTAQAACTTRSVVFAMVADALRDDDLTATECRAVLRVIEECWPERIDTDRIIEGERIMFLDAMQCIYTGDTRIDGVIPKGSPALAFFRGQHRKKHDAINAYCDAIAPYLTRPPRERRTGGPDFDAVMKHATDDDQIDPLVSAHRRLGWVVDADRAHRDAIRLMLALELYRFAHADYPASLGALAPDFLPQVPTDRYASDGRFRYIYDASSDKGGDYTLYSVGFDGFDDGARQAENRPQRQLEPPSLSWTPSDPALPPGAGHGADQVFTASDRD